MSLTLRFFQCCPAEWLVSERRCGPQLFTAGIDWSNRRGLWRWACHVVCCVLINAHSRHGAPRVASHCLAVAAVL